MGMGHYTRGQHETAIIAARGRAASLVTDHSIRDVMHAPVPWNWDTNRAIHSAKPEKFYGLVERLVDGPYLELFARARRRGWTTLGNEAGQRRA
jgi:N6-adenosine-specific RNA methylase IME4